MPIKRVKPIVDRLAAFVYAWLGLQFWLGLLRLIISVLDKMIAGSLMLTAFQNSDAGLIWGVSLFCLSAMLISIEKCLSARSQ